MPGLNQPVLPAAIATVILMTVLRFDHPVSKQASEVIPRTIGIPQLVGSAEFGNRLLAELRGALENRRVFIDRCDPHADRPRTPACRDVTRR